MYAGMYVSAGAMLTGMYRMDVHSNNMANLETIGFKSDLPIVRQRPAPRVEQGSPFIAGDKLMDALGGGVLMSANRVSTRQGTMSMTKNPLDVAVQGEGYFVVNDRADPASPVKFSRDGRLAINRTGQLVQAASGRTILDTSNRPITLNPDGAVTIDSKGTIRQDGDLVATLQLATISDQSQMRKAGNGMLTAPETMIKTRTAASGSILSGALERSTVDPVRAMMDFGSSERAAGSGVKMVQMYDELMNKAINSFGKLA